MAIPTTPRIANLGRSDKLILKTLEFLQRKKTANNIKDIDVLVWAMISVSYLELIRIFAIDAEPPQKSVAITMNISP